VKIAFFWDLKIVRASQEDTLFLRYRSKPVIDI
jgi:hypothetical protein